MEKLANSRYLFLNHQENSRKSNNEGNVRKNYRNIRESHSTKADLLLKFQEFTSKICNLTKISRI